MKMTIRSVFMFLAALVLATSCLNTDETEYTYYNDTALTAFSLGTVNRYYLTKKKYACKEDGVTKEDSLVKKTVTGSSYEFYIDQSANKIYNNDSLPQGSDAEHIICSVSSQNSGIIIIKYTSVEGEDSLAYYSSSDSIDFTTPREFRVYANDGSAYRSYEVKVNVHEEDPDSFRWNNCATVADFTGLTGMKAACVGGKMLVFASKGGQTTVHTTGCKDGKTWSKEAETLDSAAYKNIAVLGGTLYTVSGGNLLSTTDGASWTEEQPFSHARLLGAGEHKLYALTAEGGITASADNGATWEDEVLDGDAAQFPADSISLATLPVNTNSGTENIVLVGLRDMTENPNDTAAVVWGTVEEYGNGVEAQPWVFYQSEGGYSLPALANVSMTRYGNVLVALGGSPQGKAQTAGYTYLYMSKDKGITWLPETDYVLPKGFTNGTSDIFALAAGDNNILWIICGDTGQVWRGRLNRLGWKVYYPDLTE